MVFTNVINPRSHIPRKHEFKETLVKKGATIGTNATIVCGHTIGRYAFIGAGAVVTKDVPDYALMLGNPAEVAGWMCECGHQLDLQSDITTCFECGKEYIQSGEEVSAVEDRKNAYRDVKKAL
jgi:UDP-2-acetamido-3-amino-2,3-dideoxy-glucuronate N-acetyltransferase